jgi:5-methylcytosine-specific restriction endonuclease McrA
MYTSTEWLEKQKKQSHSFLTKTQISTTLKSEGCSAGERNGNYKHGLCALKSRIKRKADGICSYCKTGIKGSIGFLDLHHKNGDHQDTREENIVAICPNCHRKEHLKTIINKEQYVNYSD